RTRRPHRRVELEIFVDFAALAEPGGVDKYDPAPFIVERRIDRVPRGPGFGGDDEPVLTQQRVHETRLADVRPADDGDMNRLVCFGCWSIGQQRDELIEQVAAALSDRRGHRKRLPDSELVEGQVTRLVGEIVGLIDDQQYRPFCLAQVLYNLEVHRLDARLDVHDI